MYLLIESQKCRKRKHPPPLLVDMQSLFEQESKVTQTITKSEVKVVFFVIRVTKDTHF